MIVVFTVIIIAACLALAFFVLIQNPKGGGLSGSFGSIGNQVLGVKQSTDAMEKGTWVSMGIIAALCIVCVMFYAIPKEMQQSKAAPAKQSAPASSTKK